MNIFIEAQKFYVGTQLHTLLDADENLFSLAVDIRKALDGHAYKLNEYLTVLLCGANLSPIQRTIEDADRDFRMIRHVCMDIIEEENKFCNHEYYPILKKYVDQNKVRFQDRYTLISLACALAVPELMEGMTEKYFAKLATDYRGLTDIVELRHLYRELTYAAGEQKVDRLNELIKNRFFISVTGNLYLQTLTEQYLLELLNRNAESGQLIFQIILDYVEKTQEEINY